MIPLTRMRIWLREHVFLAPIFFYQKYLSPLKPPSCRFIPNCSRYAVTAIRKHGVLAGGLMALCRVLRCNPLCRHGYDPVPDHFSLRPFAACREYSQAQEQEDSPPNNEP